MTWHLNIPVFAGQGTDAADCPQTLQQALCDAASPSGSVLLSACFDAFRGELSGLSPIEFDGSELERADFINPKDILSASPDKYAHNPIISGTRLFLIQSLRYLAHVETSSDSPSRFLDVLKLNTSSNLGVLGFSSGMLPACVVAASSSTLSYISHAVEAFRLAFWVGLRAQGYRRRLLHAGGNPVIGLPWSVIFFGMDRHHALDAIDEFNQKYHLVSSLSITAVTSEQFLTISGHPNDIQKFLATAPPNYTIHKTTLNTLYHSPSQLTSVRRQILQDINSHAIKFPEFSDIIAPLRSTYTGDLLDNKTTSGSLAEAVVDMLLIQPVNWDRVISAVVSIIGDREGSAFPALRLLNFGPGTGLMGNMEKAFKCESVDLSGNHLPIRNSVYGTEAKQEPIAIVGMAVNMPGAPNAEKLWEILEQGINTCSEIPESRFKVSNYTNPADTESTRTLKTHTGNFISSASSFDNKFFKVSPREARSMDPQQRVLLHTAYEALENAGYVPDATPSFRRETIGCFIGAATHEYVQNLKENIDVHYSTGTLAAFLSGRISYAMQLGGPSMTVDTACSSSLVAIHQACRALANGDCNAAVAGGVNIITSPDMTIGLDRAHFLSPTGQCKTFDATADGYSRGEGCGIFVLKRLPDAISENDNILGVIRGIEVNQSGLTHSITRPHAPTQMALFQRVLKNAGVDAKHVSVVEAHGTGTQAGDPCELESIRSILNADRTAHNPLRVTSIKANIGHLEAASGAAGLVKLLLMLRYAMIPRQILFENLNPKILPLDRDFTVISTEHTPWPSPQDGATRLALLNNFGAAGSNAALLLEEFLGVKRAPMPIGIPFVFGFSAKTSSALHTLRSRYLEWFKSPESDRIRFCDIAYTCTARRQIYPHRMAMVANDKKELVQKCSTATAVHVTHSTGMVVFVFSGQGGQYFGMGASLYHTFPVYKQHIDECHRFLVENGFSGILPILTGSPVPDNKSTQQETFEAYQVAIFALEYALAKLWMSWGISLAAVVGHSLGEFAALVIAEVITFKSALTILANRARLMIQKCILNSSGMIAINLAYSAVLDILNSSNAFHGLSIACYNSTVDCAVSGSMEGIKVLKAYLDSNMRCKSVILAVPFAYHSSVMGPLLADLETVAKGVSFRAPTIPVASTVLGKVVLPGDGSIFNAQYAARHCAEPVLFDQGVSALVAIPAATKAAAWIELGPTTMCLPLLKSNAIFPQNVLLLGSLRRHQDALATLAGSMQQLYLSNVNIVWRQYFAHLPSLLCADLPSYPFSMVEFWVDFTEQNRNHSLLHREPNVPQLVSKYSMIHSWSQFPSQLNGGVAIFETPIEILAEFICGHVVGGFPLCPASVYLEQVLAGIDIAKDYLHLTFPRDRVVLRSIKFIKPLIYVREVSRTVKTKISLNSDGSGTFTVSSQTNQLQEDIVHVRGDLCLKSKIRIERKFSRSLPYVIRQIDAVIKPKDGTSSEILSKRTAYQLIFPRIVDYGSVYRTMQTLTINSTGTEGSAIIQLPDDENSKKNFLIHPVFVDTLFHIAGFIANMQGGVNDAYICDAVGSMKVIPEFIDKTASYVIYCCNTWIEEEGVMLAESYALLSTEPKRIVAQLKGLQFRRVHFDSFKRGLSLAAGLGTLLSPVLAPSPNSARDIVSQPTHLLRSSLNGKDASTTARVIEIVSDTCNIDSEILNIHVDLASMGVDSPLSSEIIDKLRGRFPDVQLNSQSLALCRTIAEIVEGLCHTATTETSLTSPSTTKLVDKSGNVKNILASVLGLGADGIDDNADLKALGLDSMASIEALYALNHNLGYDLPHDIFTNCTTVQAVQSSVSARLPTTIPDYAAAAAKALAAPIDPESIVKAFKLGDVPVPIQKNSAGGHFPLFLIHDGSGLVSYYDRLSPLGRDVWGIHNPHFMSEIPWPWDSLVAMAAEYADYVMNLTSDPVVIGGWSFGGVVAFEVSRQLLKKGMDARVILIDSPSPINHVPLPDPLLQSIIGLDPRNTRLGIAQFVQAQFRLNSIVLGEYNPQPADGPFPPLVLLRSREGFQPVDIPGVPKWLVDRSDVQQAIAGWEFLTGSSVKVWDIPGHHFQPFHPANIEEVSRQISEGCTYLERL